MVAFNGMNWLFGGSFDPDAEPQRGSGELLDIHVGARLRCRRLALGISTIRASDSVGISRALLAAYERGEIRIASSRLITMAELLEVDVGYFFP